MPSNIHFYNEISREKKRRWIQNE